MGLVGGGAQAELVVVHQDEALPIPDGLSYAEAAAIPEAFLTAYDALVTRGRLQPGERVLIHAVGSGVGTAASQIAKHLGATVLGTSRSGDKLARALVYGLDIGIDTSRTPFPEAVGEPVDVVLDVLGGPALADNLAVLAPRGRLILLGFLAGSQTRCRSGPAAAEAAGGDRDRHANPRTGGANSAGSGVRRANAAAFRAALGPAGGAPAGAGANLPYDSAGRCTSGARRQCDVWEDRGGLVTGELGGGSQRHARRSAPAP